MDNLRDLIFEMIKKMNEESVNVKTYIDSLVESGKLRQDEILGFRMRIYNIIKGKITNLKDYIVVENSNPLVIKLNNKYSDEEINKIWNESGFMVKRKNKSKKYSELVKDVRNTILNSEFNRILNKSDVIPWEDMEETEKIKYTLNIVKISLLSHYIERVIFTNNIDRFNEAILNPKNYVIYFDESILSIKENVIKNIENIIKEYNLKVEVINEVN